MSEDWKIKAVVGEKIYDEVFNEFGKITEVAFREMMSRSDIYFYVNKAKTRLLSCNSEIWVSEFGKLTEVSALEVYLCWGIDVMEEADEKGVVTIRRDK